MNQIKVWCLFIAIFALFIVSCTNWGGFVGSISIVSTEVSDCNEENGTCIVTIEFTSSRILYLVHWRSILIGHKTIEVEDKGKVYSFSATIPVGTFSTTLEGEEWDGTRTESKTVTVTCQCPENCQVPLDPKLSIEEGFDSVETDQPEIEVNVKADQLIQEFKVTVNDLEQILRGLLPSEFNGGHVYTIPFNDLTPGTNRFEIKAYNSVGDSNQEEGKIERHGISFDPDNPTNGECDENEECTVQLVFWANYLGAEFRVTVGEDAGEWRGGQGGIPVNGRYPYRVSVTVPEGSHIITVSVRYNNHGFDAVDTISTEIECQCHIPVGYRLETTIPVGRESERPVDLFRSRDPGFPVDILTTDLEDTNLLGYEAKRVYKTGCPDGSCHVAQKKPEGHADEKKYGNFHGISQGTMLGNVLQLCSGGILVDFVGGVVNSFFSNLSGVMGAMHSSGLSGRLIQVANPSDPINPRSGTKLETYSLFNPGEPVTQRSIPAGIIDITAVDTISKPEANDNPFIDQIIATNAETSQILSFNPAGVDEPTTQYALGQEHGRITSIDVLTATANETKVLVTTITDSGIAKTHVIDIQSGSYITGFVTHDSRSISDRDEDVFYVAVSDDEGRIYVIHSHFLGVQVWVPAPELGCCCR